jgi:predicted nucleic acid-binding protein
MSADSFIDSNVVVYLLDDTAPEKQRRAESLIVEGLDRGDCCISHQVVQETLNVATRKLNFTVEDASRLLDRILQPLRKVMPTTAMYQRGLIIQSRYRYSFYDSLIVAAALEAGCKTLYSEDMQNGQEIERLTILNPFRD